MQTLPTWGGKSSFSYTGSVEQGTRITYGGGFSATISADQYVTLLNHFRGRTVDIGTSRTAPPTGSVGEWLQANVTKVAVASYVGRILIEEGYAEKVKDGEPQIRFFGIKQHKYTSHSSEVVEGCGNGEGVEGGFGSGEMTTDKNTQEDEAAPHESRRGLRDPMWQFIGAMVSIIGIIVAAAVAYNIFFLQQEVKSLQIVILASNSLRDKKLNLIPPDINISYKDQPVNNLTSIEMRIENNGNRPIRKADFEQPIQLALSPSARVLTNGMFFYSETGAVFGFGAEVEGNTLTLSPILLSEGESVNLSFFVINLPPDDSERPFHIIGGRIVGVKDIPIVNQATTKQADTRLAAAMQQISPFAAISMVAISCLTWVAVSVSEETLSGNIYFRRIIATILVIATLLFVGLYILTAYS